MSREQKHLKSKIAVIIIGVIVSIYAIFYGALCIFLVNDLENPFVLLYGFFPICILIGIVIAARMRMKELSDGELDEAKKY